MRSYDEARQALEPAVGVPFKDLAPVVLGHELPTDSRKRKAAGGQISERLLEIAENSLSRADLAAFGTEVKSLPLNTLSRPRERTKITAFNLETTKSQPDFRRSKVFEKLRSVLFVPVMKANNDEPDFWYLRPPFLWLPSEEHLELLDADYRVIQAAAAEERWEGLTGAPGELLTLGTSDSSTRGKAVHEKRRAWWLKAEFVRSQILPANLWPRETLAARRERLDGSS